MSDADLEVTVLFTNDGLEVRGITTSAWIDSENPAEMPMRRTVVPLVRTPAFIALDKVCAALARDGVLNVREPQFYEWQALESLRMSQAQGSTEEIARWNELRKRYSA